ncbi:MAG TPA: VanW family protein, partial [Chloroflexota bacterium]
LIRPVDHRRNFTSREAQRRLQEKERPRWALIAYGIFLAALLIIFAVTYTTYAFSKYRGVILPGVTVDQLSVGQLSPGQARSLLEENIGANWFVPVKLVYGHDEWPLSRNNIGLQYDIKGTVDQAMQVGRSESFPEQLLDRLPLHPSHSVPLIYQIRESALRQYLLLDISHNRDVSHGMVNAGLRVVGNDVQLIPSRPGNQLDVAGTETIVRSALGAVTTQVRPLSIKHFKPVISNDDALRFRARVEAFLNSPPIIQAGKRVFVTHRSDFIHALSFTQQVSKKRAAIVMQVNSTAISNFVQSLAQQVDRNPQNPKIRYNGGQVSLVAALVIGRTLNQADATQKLLSSVTHLTPHARLRFMVTSVQPPVDQTNPASLGITSPIGYGETSFKGAPVARLSDIEQVAGQLNDRLIAPNEDIDFNQLATTNWPNSFYVEREREVNGKVVPGEGGAVQQVATTLFRAMYQSGLTVLERHNHVHRFGWYEPPVGLDAQVSPGGQDLIFRNSTHHYLLIQTQIEPLRRELWIYVYGPKLGWHVSVDMLGTITKVYPHGPARMVQDPTLSDGQSRQVFFAHDGADTVVRRTITYANGRVRVDKIFSHYQAWQAVIRVGGPIAKPTPKSTPSAKNGTSTPATSTTPTPLAEPSPTPTFNH